MISSRQKSLSLRLDDATTYSWYEVGYMPHKYVCGLAIRVGYSYVYA